MINSIIYLNLFCSPPPPSYQQTPSPPPLRNPPPSPITCTFFSYQQQQRFFEEKHLMGKHNHHEQILVTTPGIEPVTLCLWCGSYSDEAYSFPIRPLLHYVWLAVLSMPRKKEASSYYTLFFIIITPHIRAKWSVGLHPTDYSGDSKGLLLLNNNSLIPVVALFWG